MIPPPSPPIPKESPEITSIHQAAIEIIDSPALSVEGKISVTELQIPKQRKKQNHKIYATSRMKRQSMVVDSPCTMESTSEGQSPIELSRLQVFQILSILFLLYSCCLCVVEKHHSQVNPHFHFIADGCHLC